MRIDRGQTSARVHASIFYGGLFLLPIVFFPLYDFSLSITKSAYVVAWAALLAISFGVLLITSPTYARARVRAMFSLCGSTMAVYALSAVILGRLLLDGISNEDVFSFVFIPYAVLTVCSLVLVYFFARGILETYGDILRVLHVLFFGGLAAVVVEAVAVMSGVHADLSATVVGSPVNTAIYAGLQIILGYVLLAHDVSATLSRRILYGVGLMFAVGTLIIFSETVVWVLVCAGLLFLVTHHHVARSLHTRRNSGMTLCVVGIILIALLSISTDGFDAIIPGEVPSELRPSLELTLNTVSHFYATGDVADILVGGGQHAFLYTWHALKPLAVNYTNFATLDVESGNSAFTTGLLTTGALGTLSWIALFAFAIREHTRWVYNADYDSALGASYSVLLVYTALWFFLYVPELVVLTILLVLAAPHASAYTLKQRAAPPLIVRRSTLLRGVGGVLVVGGCSLGYVVVVSTVSAFFYERAIHDIARQSYDRATTYLDRSIDIVPLARYYRTHSQVRQLQATDVLLSVDPENLTEAELATFDGYTNEAISYAREATNYEPGQYLNWAVLGNVYTQIVLLGGESARGLAADAYMRAYELAPRHPGPPYLLSRIELDGAERRRLLRESLTLKPDYSPAVEYFREIEGAASSPAGGEEGQ